MALYTYLISSLPFLEFNEEPPFSFEKFLDICKDFIEEDELNLLKSLRDLKRPDKKIKGIDTFKKWLDFEYSLRNELVSLRASRKHIDPNKYLREGNLISSDIQFIALAGIRNPSILEAELILDRARWNKLEELTFGHFFDIDFLVVYGLKLLILEKWQRFKKADKNKIFKELFGYGE